MPQNGSHNCSMQMDTMSIIKPQPKTKELINQLVKSFINDVNIEELELKRIEREAERLPSYRDKNLVLGLISMHSDDFLKAKNYFHNAISSSASDNYTYNYLIICHEHFRKMTNIKNVIQKGLKLYPNSVSLNKYLLDISGKGLDVFSYEEAANSLCKMKKYTPVEDDKIFHVLLRFTQNIDDDEKQKIRLVGDEVLSLCEEFELRIAAQSIYQLEDESISCFYEVTQKKRNIDSFDLNWAFAGRMVKNDLLKAPVVINFQLVKEDN